MFCCQLCPSSNNEYCYLSRYCSKCIDLKNIIKIYGIDEVLEKVKKIYLREQKPLENRTKKIALDSIEHEKTKLTKEKEEKEDTKCDTDLSPKKDKCPKPQSPPPFIRDRDIPSPPPKINSSRKALRSNGKY